MITSWRQKTLMQLASRRAFNHATLVSTKQSPRRLDMSTSNESVLESTRKAVQDSRGLKNFPPQVGRSFSPNLPEEVRIIPSLQTTAFCELVRSPSFAELAWLCAAQSDDTDATFEQFKAHFLSLNRKHADLC